MKIEVYIFSYIFITNYFEVATDHLYSQQSLLLRHPNPTHDATQAQFTSIKLIRQRKDLKYAWSDQELAYWLSHPFQHI